MNDEENSNVNVSKKAFEEKLAASTNSLTDKNDADKYEALRLSSFNKHNTKGRQWTKKLYDLKVKVCRKQIHSC